VIKYELHSGFDIAPEGDEFYPWEEIVGSLFFNQCHTKLEFRKTLKNLEYQLKASYHLASAIDKEKTSALLEESLSAFGVGYMSPTGTQEILTRRGTIRYISPLGKEVLKKYQIRTTQIRDVQLMGSIENWDIQPYLTAQFDSIVAFRDIVNSSPSSAAKAKKLKWYKLDSAKLGRVGSPERNGVIQILNDRLERFTDNTTFQRVSALFYGSGVTERNKLNWVGTLGELAHLIRTMPPEFYGAGNSKARYDIATRCFTFKGDSLENENLAKKDKPAKANELEKVWKIVGL
jgi:hypothetical protein